MAKRQIQDDAPSASRDGRAHLLVVGAEEFRRVIERIRAEKVSTPRERADDLRHAA
jgi:hypothetical protein